MEGSSSSSTRREEDNNKKNNDDDDKKKPWSWSENKVFELALANLPENDENWFEKIVALTGRSLEDVIEHFSLLINDVIRIERGLTELPKYPDDDSDSDSDSDPQQHNRLRIGDATGEEAQHSQEMKQEGSSNVEEAEAERTN